MFVWLQRCRGFLARKESGSRKISGIKNKKSLQLSRDLLLTRSTNHVKYVVVKPRRNNETRVAILKQSIF